MIVPTTVTIRVPGRALKRGHPQTDLPPSDGAKSKLGIADVKEGNHAAEEAFG